MRVHLVRHLPVNAAGRCYGRLDWPAADDGGILADCLIRTGVRAVWSSPAARCLALAGPAAAGLGVTLRLDPRLQELDFGDWEGLAWDHVPRALLDRWAADPASFAPPGGESGAALLARVTAFAAILVHEAQDCLVVSHGGPLRLLPALLRGEPAELLAPAPPCSIVTVIETAHRVAPLSAPLQSALSTTHSVSTEAAPNTSPV